MNIFTDNFDPEKYIMVSYYLKSKTNLREAAWALAIGQSVGNPNMRSKWETEELFKRSSAIVLSDEFSLKNLDEGEVDIAFPVANLDWDTDGISQLLCFIMGGQLDIDIIEKCVVTNILFPESIKRKLPVYGLSGMRKFTNVYNKPLLGGIVKPKTGMSSDILLDIVKEMVDGGINFIKEDEILGNPAFCTIEDRVPKIMRYLQGKNVIYAVCINSDPFYSIRRAERVYELGGNGIHINFWSGLGVYKSIRDMDLPLFMHVQSSGINILTNKSNKYSISWHVICILLGMSGVDSVHIGMIGGYSNSDYEEVLHIKTILDGGDIISALSCGMTPEISKNITKLIGPDYMANVGGYIHSHPNGTRAGVEAMRRAIDNQ